MTEKKVLDVGQCDYDHGNISRLLQSHFRVAVDRAHTPGDALARLASIRYDLVLLNRVFDHDGSAGLDLLRQLKNDDRLRHLPVMLITNYEDVQEQAVELGALPGFGKADLHDQRTLERLRGALGAEPPSQ
jgi:two-component system chemotaxis response regulator CheY